MSGPVPRVVLPGLGKEVSVLGMGCASLGSRVGAAEGRRALDRAADAGVTWFDLAPAYGGGTAETIFADFVRDQGERIQICTKVGLAPPAPSPLKRALLPLARQVAGAASPLRRAIRRSGVTANQRVALTPDLISRSLEASLTRLGVQQVALYALHNAGPADLRRDDILTALETLLASGKAAAIAVAGDHLAARAAISAPGPIGVAQFAHPGADADATLLADAVAAGLGCITHSVMGVGGQLQALAQRLRAEPALSERLRSAGFADPATLLLARAREENTGGVTLVSMFSTRSLQQNLAALSAPPGASDLCREIGI